MELINFKLKICLFCLVYPFWILILTKYTNISRYLYIHRGTIRLHVNDVLKWKHLSFHFCIQTTTLSKQSLFKDQ